MFTVSVLLNHAITDDLGKIVLDEIPEDFRKSHSVPGQYVKIEAVGLEPRYFVIGSPPGSERIEFLVGRGGELANALLNLKPKEHVRITKPEGNGFPLATQKRKDLFLFSVGTGAAGIYPVIREIMTRRDDYGRVICWFGVKTQDHFPYREELPEFRLYNIDVTVEISRPDDKWQVLRNYCSSCFKNISQSSALFVCGGSDIVSEVKNIAGKNCIPNDRIFTNY